MSHEALPLSGQVHPLRESILVAEDNGEVRRRIVAILEREGYTVIEAANGQQALEASERTTGPVDLLVTDLRMPRLGGRELAHRIATDRHGMRVIVVSGDPFVPESLRLPYESPVGCIRKPFTSVCLIQAVRRILGKSQPGPS